LQNILLYFFFILHFHLNAQLHENNWISSYFCNKLNNEINVEAVTIWKFHQNRDPEFIADSTQHTFLWNNSYAMSDSTGELLYYTNGLSIYDKYGEIIENGDSLNYTNEFRSLWVPNKFIGGAYPSGTSSFSIPFPGKKNTYILFHDYRTFIYGEKLLYHLLYTIVDMSHNNGRGKVLQKNILVTEGDIGSATPIQHGNGRDWWLIIPETQSNISRIFYISPAGINFYKNYRDEFASEFSTGSASSYPNKISPSGEYYAKYDYCNSIRIYKIDRCNINMELYRVIKFDFDNNDDCTKYPGFSINGMEFSPDSKLLYANERDRLYQFDVEHYNPPTSNYLIANARLKVGEELQYHQMAMGTDDKIYINTHYYHNNYFHRINKPNEKGQACDLIFDYLENKNRSALPARPSPKYRLGKMLDSICDTIK